MSLPAAKAQHFSEVKTKGLLAWKPWTSSESWRHFGIPLGLVEKLLLLWFWGKYHHGFPLKKNICIPGQYESSHCSNPTFKSSNVFPTSGLPIWLKLTGVPFRPILPYYYSHSHRGKPPKPSKGFLSSWHNSTWNWDPRVQPLASEKILGDKLRDVFFLSGNPPAWHASQ